MKEAYGVKRSLFEVAEMFRAAPSRGHPEAAERTSEMAAKVSAEEDGMSDDKQPAESERSDPDKDQMIRYHQEGRCPYCGSKHRFGVDMDSWVCCDCGKSWPTGAFACHHPGCFEWTWDKYCEEHMRLVDDPPALVKEEEEEEFEWYRNAKLEPSQFERDPEFAKRYAKWLETHPFPAEG